MNLLEVWFSIIERQAIHRSSFTSVSDVIAKISAFITGWNDRAHPFTWTQTPEQILSKANRKKISDAGHWQGIVHPPGYGRKWLMNTASGELTLETLAAQVAALEQVLGSVQAEPPAPRGCACSSATAAVPAVQATGSNGAARVDASSDTGIGLITQSGGAAGSG